MAKLSAAVKSHLLGILYVENQHDRKLLTSMTFHDKLTPFLKARFFELTGVQPFVL